MIRTAPSARTSRRMPSRLRVALVHKMPTPYRTPVFDLLASHPGIELTVVYSSEREPNRQWTRPAGRARTVYLPERILDLGENHYVHVNWGVGRELRRIRPHVVVTNGFNVTDLLVLGYAARTGAVAVCQIDGTPESERTLTPLHRLVRRLADRFTAAYAGPSRSTLELFRSFGADPAATFWSPLAVDNGAFPHPPLADRGVDLLFAGRLTEIKNPVFAVEVAAEAADRLGRRLRLVVAGSGALESAVREAARANPGIDVELRGFVQQQDLPALYASARLFLFPTSWDPWGVVANEAAAAGTPVLVSPHAGAAGELIRHEREGLVLPVERERWVRGICDLLSDEPRWSAMSHSAVAHVSGYSWQAAADGYAAAIEYAAATAVRRS